MYKDVRGGRDVAFLWACEQKFRQAPTIQNLQQILNTGERCSPLQLFGQVLPPQNRSALCVSTLRLGLERRCRFHSPISLLSDVWLLYAFDTTICTLSACAEWGSASYSDRALPCTHNGFHPLTLTRDVSLDLLLASLGALFYFMLAIYFGLLCSFLIPHFSFLTPHLNLPSDNFFTPNCVMFKLSL